MEVCSVVLAEVNESYFIFDFLKKESKDSRRNNS